MFGMGAGVAPDTPKVTLPGLVNWYCNATLPPLKASGLLLQPAAGLRVTAAAPG